MRINMRIFSVVTLAFLLGHSLCVKAEHKYELVEKIVFWPDHQLTNPFTDTELKLYIVSPNGQEFVYYGFYDGNGQGGQNGELWKYRILLNKAGRWEVQPVFVMPGTDKPSLGAPKFAKMEFQVIDKPIKSSAHGHISVAQDNFRRYLHHDGTPWFPFPFHASAILNQKQKVYQQYIQQHLKNSIDILTIRFHYDNHGMVFLFSLFVHLFFLIRNCMFWSQYFRAVNVDMGNLTGIFCGIPVD